ncbi:hypothetical protein M9Y10_018172 [Tritrichomonas musculus]|uniref:Ricin B lectin domain-containing protein n=1 Tax=Tritrichomonas musculus TaxID=1915356 RepID=A0ABR2HPL3_9EUKA
MHENQTWTVDKDGYIVSWKNRDMVIYAGNLKNSQLQTITKLSSIPAVNKNQARWRLTSTGIIENMTNHSFVLDVDSAGGYKNNTKIHVYIKHSKTSQLFHCIEVHESKKFEVKPMIGSIILAQCREVIIYEAKTDSKIKPKKITIHNGMRYRPGKDLNKVNYKIDDFVKKYGVKSVKEIEIKFVDPDNKHLKRERKYLMLNMI